MSSDHSKLWSAPFCGHRSIDATVTIPGSKSITNRALVLAALAESPSRIVRPLHSRDSELMGQGLRALGVQINEDGDSLGIEPSVLRGPASIDVGNAGTVMRFLPAVAALAQGIIHFDGDPRSHERPLAPLIKALEDLGVSIEHSNRYSLPLTINGSGWLRGGEIKVDASSSSQFVSALLLIGSRTRDGLTVVHDGSALPSQPHIDMTIAMIEEFGGKVEVSTDQIWYVAPRPLHGKEIVIEPDLSNAAPFMAAAMVAGGQVTITDWPKQTDQPGDQLRSIFKEMGAQIDFVGSDIKVTGNGTIKGIDIDLHDVGELTPTIAAVAALAETPSYLRGIGHLRLHETDRLAALAREINALGGAVSEEPDALRIKPRQLKPGIFHTYDDHRLATAGAVLGLRVNGIEVENIDTTRKTLPDFPGLWRKVVG